MPRLVRVSRPFPGPGGLVALLLLVSACGGETPGAPPPPPPVPPPPPPPIDGGLYEGVACPALQPARAAGQPLERIGLGQVPGSFQAPLFAYVREQGGAAQGFSLVELSEAGALELVVPIHPSGSPAGGPARVWISDGTRACAAFDFTVQALPPAPGEFAAVVGLVQALVAQQAAALGTTPAELQSLPPGQVPPELLGLAVAQALVDHPGNPRSLAQVVSGTSPFAAEVRLDLLEPVLAGAGVRAALEAAIVPAAGSAGPGRLGGRTARSNGAEPCSPEDIGEDPEILANCLKLSQEVRRKLINLMLSTGPLEVGNVAIELALGEAGLSTGEIGTLLRMAALIPLVRKAASLPGELTEATVTAVPAVFAEDRPGQGSWTATVSAKNEPLEMVEFLKRMLGEGIQGTLEKLGRVAGVLRLLGAGDIVDELLGGDLATLDVAEMTFGPVNISDEEWSESEAFLEGEAFERVSHSSYLPKRVGTATLEVRSKGFEPGDVDASTTLEVREIEMEISPKEVVLNAGEEVEFTVTVTGTHAEEAVDTVLRGGAPRGTVVSRVLGSVTAGEAGRTEVYRLRYRAPAQPGVDQALEVGLKHTARTGARAAPAAPVREAVAEVRFGKVEISPSGICLEPGASQTFTATVTGLTSQAVNWTASSGNITSNGVYTAAAGTPPGTAVTITATSRVNDKFKDQVTIQVGCVCAFQITLDGNPFTAQPGDSVSYVDFGGLTGFSMNTWQDPLAPSLRRTAAVGVTLDPRISGPGAWNFGRDQAEFGDLLGQIAAPPNHVWWNGGEHNFFSFVLDQYEPGVKMAGSLSGFTNLESLLDASVRIVPISMTFSMYNTEPDFLGIFHTCVVK